LRGTAWQRSGLTPIDLKRMLIMAEDSINFELVHIALERATGSVFEKFVNSFYPSIAGENFVPLGGY